MTGTLNNLDAECPHCGRVVGEHTLRDWSGCLGTTDLDLPYEDVDDVARAFTQGIGLPDDTIMADHFTAKALAAQGSAGGPVKATFPLVLLEFSRSPDVGNVIARVALVGDTSTVRSFGRLVRDTSNGAANAAERAA